jgi:hypothetical protein
MHRSVCEMWSSHCNDCEDVFWDVTPCNLVNRYRRFGGTYYLYLRGISPTLKTDAVSSSETSITTYQTAQRHISEDCSLNTWGSVMSTLSVHAKSSATLTLRLFTSLCAHFERSKGPCYMRACTVYESLTYSSVVLHVGKYLRIWVENDCNNRQWNVCWVGIAVSTFPDRSSYCISS